MVSFWTERFLVFFFFFYEKIPCKKKKSDKNYLDKQEKS